MIDFGDYKVDLETARPNPVNNTQVVRGDSPRTAFTKYNDLLDAVHQAVRHVGPLAPSPTSPWMQWLDTSIDPPVERQRNGIDTAWVLATVNGALRVDSNGNVGIGTPNPQARLTVANAVGEHFEFTTASVTYNGGVLEYINRTAPGTRPDFSYLINGAGAHKFYTNGLERFQISGNGSLGVGVTPSSWGGTLKAIEGTSGGYFGFDANNVHVGLNNYWNGAAFVYKADGLATNYYQNAGGHFWRIASTGAAGDVISWATALQISAAGNIGIGASPPTSRLHIAGAGGAVPTLLLENTVTGAGSFAAVTYRTPAAQYSVGTEGNGRFYIFNATQARDQFALGAGPDSFVAISALGSGPIAFYTNNQERVTVDATGSLLIGANNKTSTERVLVKYNAPGAIPRTLQLHNASSEAGSGDAVLFSTFTNNGSFVDVAYVAGFGSDTVGSGGLVFATSIAGVASEKVRIDSAGNVGIGASVPTAPLDVNGNLLRLRAAKTPTSATAVGNAGDICWDSNYIYVCVATNTWKRSAIATW